MKRRTDEARERATRLALACGCSVAEALSDIRHDMECESAAVAALRERPTRKK